MATTINPSIILINPPQTFYQGSQNFSVGLPVGLLSIAAVLREHGCRVTLIDALISNFQATAIDRNRIHYGMSWETLAAELQEKAPLIVGISIPFTAQETNGITAIHLAKRCCPKAKIMAGGPHLSVRYQEFMAAVPECDFVVRGEGEETALDLVRCVREQDVASLAKIPGLSYRLGGQCHHNAPRKWNHNLDALPLPAYDLVDMERYLDDRNKYLYANRFGKQRREVPVFTSRGCPFKCVFCSINLHMGRSWRPYSVAYVLNHLELLVNRYKVDHIHFEDDNFTLDTKRFHALLDNIISKNLQFTWDTPNGVRADTLDLPLLQKAKRAGLQLLTIAVESGSQRVLDQVIQKNLSLAKVVEVARYCHELNIPLRAFFVVGFPGETVAEMQETLQFGLFLKEKFHVDWNFLVATPLFGTKLYEMCLANNYLVRPVTPESISQATMEHGSSLIKTPDFSPDDIKKVIRLRQRGFFRIRLFWFLRNPLYYLTRILLQASRASYQGVFGRDITPPKSERPGSRNCAEPGRREGGGR